MMREGLLDSRHDSQLAPTTSTATCSIDVELPQ